MDWSYVDYSWFLSIVGIVILFLIAAWLYEHRRIRFNSDGEVSYLRARLNDGRQVWLKVEGFVPIDPTVHQWDAGWVCYDPSGRDYFVSAESGSVYVGMEFDNIKTSDVIGEASAIVSAAGIRNAW